MRTPSMSRDRNYVDIFPFFMVCFKNKQKTKSAMTCIVRYAINQRASCSWVNHISFLLVTVYNSILHVYLMDPI